MQQTPQIQYVHCAAAHYLELAYYKSQIAVTCLAIQKALRRQENLHKPMHMINTPANDNT